MTRAFAYLLIAALATACANGLPGQPPSSGIAQFGDDPRLGEPVSSICFASNIDGFSMNRRDTVLLHEGRDRFMVEVFGTCPDLEFAHTIGVDTTASCLSKGDALIVRDTFGASAMGPRRCVVREIRAWDPKASAPEEKADET